MSIFLITGFGPFPGAPVNPTQKLVEQLTRLRRPALANVKIVGHIFETSYGAVDRDLPKLIAKHKPDALMMFGLATRAKRVRIETRARNALALLPDVGGKVLQRGTIDGDGPAALAMPAPTQHLLQAARAARVPVRLSRDAGRYLCNYLCWRAAEAVAEGKGPRLAGFVHVPLVLRNARPRRATIMRRVGTGAAFFSVHNRASEYPVRHRKVWSLGPLGPHFRGDEWFMTSTDLLRAGQNVLLALVAAVNRT